MKKGGGSDSTIIIGPFKSVLLYALHSLEYVRGLAQFRVFVPNIKKECIPRDMISCLLTQIYLFLSKINKNNKMYACEILPLLTVISGYP